uniref:Uncharacterized protein n=1 Tax=Zea mays TaxID=4577 RepID=A0A804MB79_MAIZE
MDRLIVDRPDPHPACLVTILSPTLTPSQILDRYRPPHLHSRRHRHSFLHLLVPPCSAHRLALSSTILRLAWADVEPPSQTTSAGITTPPAAPRQPQSVLDPMHSALPNQQQ